MVETVNDRNGANLICCKVNASTVGNVAQTSLVARFTHSTVGNLILPLLVARFTEYLLEREGEGLHKSTVGNIEYLLLICYVLTW